MKNKTEKNTNEQETIIDFRRPVIPEWDPSIRQPIQVGSTLNNRFVLEELIAKGGMGVVYKAKDLRKVEAMDRNPYIAIKVLTEDFKQHPESWIALQREARKSQQLAHPNIITVYDFDRDGSNVFMTMELLDGEPLTALLERVHGSGLPFKKAIPLIKGMAEALIYAHQRGIVHSDFKPGNVFITHDNIVKVLDFGIARAIISPGKRDDKTMFDPGGLGALTPAYASFEMLTNENPDSRDDIYALACVTYELLAGEHPFNKMTAVNALANHLQAKRIKHLNRKQCKGLMNGLAFRRKDRTSTVDLFLKELQYRNSSTLNTSIILLIMIALLVSAGYYGYQFLNRQQWEQRIETLELFVQEGQLSMAQTMEAALRLQEMNELVGKNARLEKLRDDLALNYLSLAKTAQGNQQWREAKDTLLLAHELEPNQNVMELLRSRLNEINNQQNLFLSISGMETRFDTELQQMQAEPDSTRKVLSILDQLAVLAPDHPLIKDGRMRIADTLAVSVREFAQQQQWQEGLQLADDLLVLLPSSRALLQARKALEKDYQVKLNEDIKVFETFVQKEQLTMAQTTEAALRLQEINEWVGKNTRLEKLRDDLALNYLSLAKTAQGNQQWREAKDTLLLAQELEPNQNVLELLRSRLNEINNQQNLFLSISGLETRFDTELQQMQAEPGSTRKVLSTLDQLAVLAPDHPLIKDGRMRIADTLAVAVREFAQQQQWQEGLQLADDLLVLLPSSRALLQARKELEKDYQVKLNEDKKIAAEKEARQRSTDLRKAKQQVETLLRNPETTAAWRDKVKRQMGRLKKRLPENDPWLTEMQASFTSINARQESLKWKGSIKAIGAEQTD